MEKRRRPSIIGPALICGLCCYVPVPGIRGAAFCLFPGLAWRSLELGCIGAFCGLMADVLLFFAWHLIAGVWEPRDSFNEFLVAMPPGYVVMTHAGSPMPNYLKFGLGLTLWMSAMFAIWMTLWKPTIADMSKVLIHLCGAMAVGLWAVILWIVAPLDGWWEYGAQPFGDLSPIPLLAVYVTSLPSCALLVGLMMHRATKLASFWRTFLEDVNH